MKNHNLIIALILLATTLVYVNGLSNPFVTDDYIIIFGNFQPWQRWTLGDLLQRSLFSSAPSESAYFRPLTLLTFALNYSLARDNPLVYRAVNLTLHLLVVFLVIVLLSRLAGRWVATLGALIYALHPVHVQAVSYISSRSEPLYTALALLCLLLWHKGNEAQGSKRRLYLGLALSAFFLGLFAKETMIVAPVLALAMDFTWNRSGSFRSKLRENLGWYGGFGALFGLYLIVRFWPGFLPLMESGRELGLGSRVFFALKLFGLYLALAFYPAHLSFFRVVPIPVNFLEWQVVSGAVLLGSMMILACLLLKIRKEISFGILWYLISIVPVLNLTLLNVHMMEHWLYLPLIGLTLAFVSGVRALAERLGEVRSAALGLILLALLLSARTVARNADWGDLLKLYQQDVLYYPGNFRAWSWLADTMKDKGMLNGAIRSYKISLGINPDQVKTWVALGLALSLAERNDEAEEIFLQAVSTSPQEPRFHHLLGLHRLKTGKNRQAVEALQKAIGLNPAPMTYHALGSAYLRLGEKKKTEQAFQKALAMFPGEARFHAGVHVDIGKLYMSQGKPKEAREEWQIALRFEPNNEEARTLLEKQPANEKS